MPIESYWLVLIRAVSKMGGVNLLTVVSITAAA